MSVETSYTITGNIPLVVRESLLTQIFDMGEQVVKASQSLDPMGLTGPFCLETVITPIWNSSFLKFQPELSPERIRI